MSGTLPDNALLAWLQDDNNDNYHSVEELETMYTYFNEDADAPIDRIKGDDRHHCFIVFEKSEGGSSECVILHHLAQHPTRMGVTTMYDGNWYFTGNQPVGGNQITYALPASLFTSLPAAQVYVPERIQRELSNTPDLSQFTYEISEDTLDELVSVTTRRGMWIPNKYAALCIEGGLSPVEVWNRVYGEILRNGHTACCAPLIQYLQYQLMGTSTLNTAIYGPTDLQQPRVTAEFLRHRSNVLSHLLADGTTADPTAARSNNTGAGAGAFAGMNATQFQDFLAALRAGHAAPAPGVNVGSTANTVDKRWSVNLDTLKKLTLVTDVSHLPPVWSALAKGPRKEERNILQAAIDGQSHIQDSSTNAKLTVSKELLATVVNLSFWSGDFDMLDEGLHPFRTVHVSTAKQAQDRANLQTYDSLARDGIIRLEDIQLFQLALKSHWPTEFLQLDTSLKLFHNLLAVLLPTVHPLLVSYGSFLKAWNSMHILLSEYFSRDRAKPAQFLRSLQLRVALYWQAVSSASFADALLIQPPNLLKLLMSVSLQSWVPPTMPGQAPAPEGLIGSGGRPAGAPPQPSGGVLPPAPSPAPSPSPAPAPGAPAPAPAPAQQEVRNSNMIQEVANAMRGRSFQIRRLFGRGVTPPTHTDGRPMCCTFHLRGRCSNTCSRSYSHTSLNAEEQAALCTFVRDRVVTPDIGRDRAAAPTPAPAAAS